MAETAELVRADDNVADATGTSVAHALARGFSAFVRAILMIVGMLTIMIVVVLFVFHPFDSGVGHEYRPVQSDLHNALTAEKNVYTDTQMYSANTAAGGVLSSYNSSLPWGTKITAVVGDATSVGDNAVVCLSEGSKNTTLHIADVAAGPDAGTYFNAGGDCSNLNPAVLAAAWNTGW